MSQTHLEPEAVDEDAAFSEPVPAGDIIGRSPSQIFWRRFRKDRLALAGVVILIIIVALALAAPLFARLVGSLRQRAVRLRDDDAGRRAARPHHQQRGGRIPLRSRRHGPRPVRSGALRSTDIAHRCPHRDRHRAPARRHARHHGGLLPRQGRHLHLGSHRHLLRASDAAADAGHRRSVRRAAAGAGMPGRACCNRGEGWSRS